MHGSSRHGLFPSILECCQTTNREGSAVLYGENLFYIENSHTWPPVFDSWGPGRANLEAITRVSLSYVPWASCAQDRRVLEILGLLPGLREVSINLRDICAEEWEAFLEATGDRLGRYKKFVFAINVLQKADEKIYQRQWPASLSTDRDRCIWTYAEPFKRQEGVWKNREVKWEFEECIDGYARCHCVLGWVSGAAVNFLE
jgi:hypothetical protein